MYSLNMPVSAIRTKMRQEFERHRYVAQLKTVDVLLFNSHSEFQVRCEPRPVTILGEHEAGWCVWREAWMTGARRSVHNHDQLADISPRVPAGNTQLLEAAHTRAQVLPTGGGAQGAATEEFHSGLSGGMSLSLPSHACQTERHPERLFTNFTYTIGEELELLVSFPCV